MPLEIDSSQCAALIKAFKAELAERDNSTMVERHILCANPAVISPDAYFALKQEVARHFNVPVPQIVMIGSGKLGFSISPSQLFQPFGEESDLDLALVSDQMFDKHWKETFLRAEMFGDWPEREAFFKYISQGWLRPDKLPHTYAFKSYIWDFLRKLERSQKHGPYQLRLAIYRDWEFLRNYQTKGIKACRGI